jgi:lauroyl/myristoyl acyltransferase
MPARATTSNRRPARGSGSTRPRSGSTAAKKRPPAKRGAAGRRPAARSPQSSLSAGAWRAAAGTWSLLARGAGGLARSVARPEEAEPLAPEHRRDGVGLAVLGLAIVIGAAAWTQGIGPVGTAVAAGVRFVIGSLVMVLPVVLFLVALRLLRHGPHPEARGRLTIGWLCVIAAVVGITHVVGGAPDSADVPGGAGGVLGWAVGSPLTAGLGAVVTILLLVLLAVFGLLVLTATPVHQVPERLREYFDRVLGRDEDDPLVELAARECFRLYGRYWYETFALRAMPVEEVSRRFTIDGREHIDRALERGRGFIIALPHMGNWDAAGHWLALNGYRMTAVAEELRPQAVFDLFLRHRRALGMNIVPLKADRTTGERLVSLLAQNHVITLVADRDLTGRGVKVEMFGAPRLLPAGPAYLSLATRTPLSVAAVYTTSHGWHCRIDPPLSVERTGDMRADVTAMTLLVARGFERAIAAAPVDWHMFQPAWGDGVDAGRVVGDSPA